MTTIYKAFDGKIFDNKDDCCKYESKLRSENNVKLWDKEYNLLPTSLSNIEKCSYFKASTKDDFDAFIDYLEDIEFITEGLYESGWNDLWGWSDKEDMWFDCTTEYNNYKKRIETMT